MNEERKMPEGVLERLERICRESTEEDRRGSKRIPCLDRRGVCCRPLARRR